MTTAGGSGYDTLNRLVAAQASSGPYQGMQAAWSYDSFGNRTSESFGLAQGAQVTAPIPPSTAVTPAISNQIQSIRVGTANYTPSYDASGDVTVDPSSGNHYAYDGEGRICAVSGPSGTMGYLYDAEGNRVAKSSIQLVMVNGTPTLSCDMTQNGFMTSNNETDYILGPGGEQVSEVAQDSNGGMNWQRTYVYAAGALFAAYDPSPDNPTKPLPSFRLTDWLGTLRATTDSAGVLQGTCTGLPFGDGLACAGNIPDPHHFTGKERDTESGNDYFGARYYASSMGRFMSPDWSAKAEPVPYAKLDNPQSLNLYSYVLNNPLGKTDPDGHDFWDKVLNTLQGKGWVDTPRPQLAQAPVPGGPPMKGVNPVTGQTLFSRDPKGQPGNERPGVGGAGNFGACRGTGCSRTHQGEDISAPVGSDIHAATGGTVTFSGVSGSQTTGYGNTVKVDDGSGTVTVYSHNSENGVSVGDTVQRGDVIGTSGQTGNAAGQPASESHVHFEVQVNGQRVDPATWLNSATQ